MLIFSVSFVFSVVNNPFSLIWIILSQPNRDRPSAAAIQILISWGGRAQPDMTPRPDKVAIAPKLTVSSQRAFGKLHGHAMQAAVLMHQGLARNANNFAVRETAGQAFQRDRIHRVAINRHQYGAVDDQKVGVIGRQLLAVLIMDRLRQRQRHQMIDIAILGPKAL